MRKISLQRLGFSLSPLGRVGVGLLLLFISSCSKEAPINPFDDPANQPPDTTANGDTLDPNSFAGLHYNIFKPTCANSGCHDGSFEPDFRTIESSYNTLVYHPIIKNNPAGSFVYRVVPYNVSQSIIMHRLTVDIDGISGIMPLALSPNSDWPEKREQYLQNITTWIQNGAKDMFGNIPVPGNKTPQFLGVVGFANGGGSPLPIVDNIMRVPLGSASVTVWFSIADDSTATQNLTYNKIKISPLPFGFDTIPETDLTVVSSPITQEGFFGDDVLYYHKTVIDLTEHPEDQIFMRIYVKDPQHNPVEIPADGSLQYITNYFSFKKE